MDVSFVSPRTISFGEVLQEKQKQQQKKKQSQWAKLVDLLVDLTGSGSANGFILGDFGSNTTRPSSLSDMCVL